MATGRNDACPCGSGKKYKKCCLPKDEARTAAKVPKDQAVPPPQRVKDFFAPAAASASPPLPPLQPQLPPPPPREPTPWDIRFDEFEALDHEGRIALFLRTLEDRELMDEAMAFEMLLKIQPACIERGQRGRFVEVVNALRERRPELIAARPGFYLAMLITEAVVANQPEEVRRLGLELAAVADKDIDELHRVQRQLAYHGYLLVLVEMYRVAWPLLKDSPDIMAWALWEFAARAGLAEMCAYLEQNPITAEIPAAVRERVKVYLPEIEEALLSNTWKHLTGQDQRTWTLADFAFRPPRKRQPRHYDDYGDYDEEDENEEKEERDPERDNLFLLGMEFVGALRREEQVPYCKGDLACEELKRYILERFAGELDPQDRWKPKGKSRARPARLANPLCPDRATLDPFLARKMKIFSIDYYGLAATFEIVPAWLRFLEARHLLTPEQHQNVLQQLQPLGDTLAKLWDTYRDDPALRQALLPRPATPSSR